MTITYKVELANKISRGRAIGNLWGVARYVDGCRNTWVLEPQESLHDASDLHLYLVQHPEYRPLAIDCRR